MPFLQGGVLPLGGLNFKVDVKYQILVIQLNICTFYLGALCAFISGGEFCHLKGLNLKLNVKHQGFGINAYSVWEL